MSLNILVTNDDGIDSKGIRLLIETAKLFGKVTVVAPDSQQSAKSHSISSEIPISYKLLKLEENLIEYACSGTPVDCVKIAIHEIMEVKPDLVLSGINHGSNTSTSVIYSGTMAAAIEGCMNGIMSIGFSVNNYDYDYDFPHTKPYIENIIKQTIGNGLPEGICLNVNFPDPDLGEIKSVKVCRGANAIWKEKFIHANNKHKKAFWLSGDFINFEPEAEDTDEFAMKHSIVSIVPVKFDFTAYSHIEKLKSQGFEQI